MRTLVPLLSLLVACSSGSSSTDAGSDVSSPGMVKQSGQVIDLDSKKGVANVTIKFADATATTDATGMYSFSVPKGTKGSMTLTRDGDAGTPYLKLIEQEWALTADVDRGTTSFVSKDTSDLLRAVLSGYDDKLAVFSLLIEKKGTACASTTGTTVAIEPPGAAILRYFKNGLPGANATSVTEGELPSAVFYNVTPGVPFTIKVTQAGCTIVPFPLDDPKIAGITYTGNVTTEAGQAASFARVFIQ